MIWFLSFFRYQPVDKPIIQDTNHTMIEEINKYLSEQMKKVNELYCLIITDRDGVPIIKILNEKCPETSMKPIFLSTFSTASDQASKLGLGKNESILCIYKNYQILQVNYFPFIIRYIASHKVNTGHMYTLHDHIKPVIEELKLSIGQSVVQ